MSATSGARARARLEVTAAIKDEARRQLEQEGAARLSLRSVARELGMVSSALYRYFASRDDLLTALIIDAYDALGAAAESAHAEVADEDPRERWHTVCTAVRAWALAKPHEYALIYGSPVPGYRAPQVTVDSAARVGELLLSVLRDAHERGAPGAPPLPPPLKPEGERMVETFAPGLPPETAVAFTMAWAELFGLISFELFGQFEGVVLGRDAFFGHAVDRLADSVGLPAAGRPAGERADRTAR
ncbi:TetR/AcrR family transcriptional regulator [Streptomyces sp. NPDC050560]|uniref:TetR/AcrR family transcriptional regulator n=1 Tax=Streptomyces sp. NPDC050560 TaxID=3365630 RepID=UPI00378E60C1